MRALTNGKKLLKFGFSGFMTAMFAYNLVTISKAYAQQIPVTPLSNMPSISDNCHLGDRCDGSRNTVHTGVDYPTESGTDVWAICDGIVKYARSSDIEIWNRFVVIEHPDCGGYSKLYAYYGHIDSELQENNHVTRGDKIGSVADWGENSHLHFGLATKLINRGWGYQEGDPVENGWIDPESFVTVRDTQTANPILESIQNELPAGTTNDFLESSQAVQVAEIFRSIVPNIQQQTNVTIRLPSQLPSGFEDQRIYTNYGVSRNGYGIDLASQPNCGANACYIGSFSAEQGGRPSFDQIVSLTNGIRGYYKPLSCGASCSPPAIQWLQGGVLYDIQMRVSRDPNEAMQQMLQLANSSIQQKLS